MRRVDQSALDGEIESCLDALEFADRQWLGRPGGDVVVLLWSGTLSRLPLIDLGRVSAA